jgi:DMSO reductase anchor subunit
MLLRLSVKRWQVCTRLLLSKGVCQHVCLAKSWRKSLLLQALDAVLVFAGSMASKYSNHFCYLTTSSDIYHLIPF